MNIEIEREMRTSCKRPPLFSDGDSFLVPWVPEVIFLLSNSQQFESRELYQTVSTDYFILGVSKTDLWSQGSFLGPTVLKFSIVFNLL